MKNFILGFILLLLVLFLVVCFLYWLKKKIVRWKAEKDYSNPKYWIYENFKKDGVVFERSILKKEYWFIMEDSQLWDDDTCYIFITDIETKVSRILSFNIDILKEKNTSFAINKIKYCLNVPISDITLDKLQEYEDRFKPITKLKDEIKATQIKNGLSEETKKLMNGEDYRK